MNFEFHDALETPIWAALNIWSPTLEQSLIYNVFILVNITIGTSKALVWEQRYNNDSQVCNEQVVAFAKFIQMITIYLYYLH